MASVSRVACALFMGSFGLAAYFSVRKGNGAPDRSKVLLDVGHGDGYYNEAERHMKKQWRMHVWDEIRQSDFRHVVEVAAGWGRNTAMLMPRVGSLIVTDINADGIEHMKSRFANESKVRSGHVVFNANDGTSLPMVPNSWATFVYSWDAMVHFADFVIAPYIAEIARILAPGGTAFLHHSNLPRCKPDHAPKGHPHPHACGVVGDVNARNPEARSVITSPQFVGKFRTIKQLVASQAAKEGLEVVRQVRIPWSLVTRGKPGDADYLYKGPAVHDCMTTLRKPVVRVGAR